MCKKGYSGSFAGNKESTQSKPIHKVSEHALLSENFGPRREFSATPPPPHPFRQTPSWALCLPPSHCSQQIRCSPPVSDWDKLLLPFLHPITGQKQKIFRNIHQVSISFVPQEPGKQRVSEQGEVRTSSIRCIWLPDFPTSLFASKLPWQMTLGGAPHFTAVTAHVC